MMPARQACMPLATVGNQRLDCLAWCAGTAHTAAACCPTSTPWRWRSWTAARCSPSRTCAAAERWARTGTYRCGCGRQGAAAEHYLCTALGWRRLQARQARRTAGNAAGAHAAGAHSSGLNPPMLAWLLRVGALAPQLAVRRACLRPPACRASASASAARLRTLWLRRGCWRAARTRGLAASPHGAAQQVRPGAAHMCVQLLPALALAL